MDIGKISPCHHREHYRLFLQTVALQAYEQYFEAATGHKYAIEDRVGKFTIPNVSVAFHVLHSC